MSNEATKVTRKDLDDLWMALSDLGANRLPYKISERISIWKLRLKTRIEETTAIRNDFVQAYLPEGRLVTEFKQDIDIQIAIGPKYWREVQEKARASQDDIVDVDFKGAPVNLAAVLGDKIDQLRMMDDSITLLKRYGLIPTGEEQ